MNPLKLCLGIFECKSSFFQKDPEIKVVDVIKTEQTCLMPR